MQRRHVGGEAGFAGGDQRCRLAIAQADCKERSNTAMQHRWAIGGLCGLMALVCIGCIEAAGSQQPSRHRKLQQVSFSSQCSASAVCRVDANISVVHAELPTASNFAVTPVYECYTYSWYSDLMLMQQQSCQAGDAFIYFHPVRIAVSQ